MADQASRLVGMGGKPIVLVADDDGALRMLCRVNLEFEGYNVLEAASAREVEESLAREDVALVLLDVHLGADDGLALATRLRELHRELPIVFLTGSVKGSVGEGIVDGLIRKPFTLEQLADLVGRLVRGRPARQA
jgi:DNA-binding response OmpR family regulator